MTNDELIAMVAINGKDAVYDARLSGYDITVPAHIRGDEGHYVLKHHVKPMFFSGSMIIDLKLVDEHSQSN